MTNQIEKLDNINFQKIKEFGVIYTIRGNYKIDSYDLNKNPKCLFDIAGEAFSDGFGGSWDYKDYNIFWSNNKINLYEKIFGEVRKRAIYFNNISNILERNVESSLKEKIIFAYLSGFYGTMYGLPFKNENQLIKIENATIGKDGCLYHIWGWPGPDCSVYRPEDYGITWVLTQEEFKR